MKNQIEVDPLILYEDTSCSSAEPPVSVSPYASMKYVWSKNKQCPHSIGNFCWTGNDDQIQTHLDEKAKGGIFFSTAPVLLPRCVLCTKRTMANNSEERDLVYN